MVVTLTPQNDKMERGISLPSKLLEGGGKGRKELWQWSFPLL